MKTCIAFHLLMTAAMASTIRKNLIIDTDIYSDVDDVGALLLAATSRHVNILAVNVNYHSTYSALAASAILAYYGHPDIPIGIRQPMFDVSFLDTISWDKGEFASKIAFHWSGGTLPWDHFENAWEPVALYRKALAEAPDGSVTIASLGFLDNLSDLLESTADTYSNLDGRALIARKVSELVIMGGAYPSGHEFNFWNSTNNSAAHVVNTWRGRMVFLGNEVGENVKSGEKLMIEGPRDDPTRMAYIYYTYYEPRPSWDPLTMLYAINGLGNLFRFGNKIGYNHVERNGSNKWVWDATVENQFFLELAVDEETAAAELDRLFLQGALSVTQQGITNQLSDYSRNQMT
ncbi:inosine/uridine-preferring nucleoside hydrolase [Xylaria arbuscula]|nr:inosine/uridine-preferring nucleoside hydrolase [Xylaria arbuscula]